MTTLSDLYRLTDKKDATITVRVAGTLLTSVKAVEWVYGIAQVPTARVVVPGEPPGAVAFFANVTIDAGFNGITTRVFTGKVQNINPSERETTIECQGRSWPLDAHFHEVVKTFSSITAQQAIEDLLDDAGITAYGVTMPSWTIGTVVEQTLAFQTYAEAITKVAEVDGARWYETPDGVVRVQELMPIPSLTAWRQYFTMRLTGTTESYPAGVTTGRPRIRRILGEQQAQEVKNRCKVRGATYTQTNADGTEDSIDVEAEASAPSSWVLFPDGSQAYNDELFANELIDTVAKAQEVAGRIVTEKNRLLTRVSVEIDGDPEIVLGATVQIEDPDYSRLTGRWFVEGYTTRIDSSGFVTVLEVLGGPEAGGTVNISPFALFTHSVEREVIGDRVWAVVTLDGSVSTDPDGTIASYSWTDNQGAPIATGTDAVIYVRADPTAITPPWEVTLTVTDDLGATDSITLTIDVEVGADFVWVPALAVAYDAWFSASPDGGETWNDQAAPGGDSVISCDFKPADGSTFGVACFGTNLGAIYRTTDYCATAPTAVMAAVGSPIVHVWWDKNHPTDVWACTQNGKVYRSQDDGVTWALYDNLATTFGLASIRLNRIATPAPDGVWVFGGTGTGYPLITWDAARDHNWVGANLGGELSTDLGGTGGGPAAGDASFIAVGQDLWVFDASGSSWTKRYNGSNTQNYCKLTDRRGVVLFIERTSSGGNLWRSGDGGFTFTKVLASVLTDGQPYGVVDYDIDPNSGVIWVLWATTGSTIDDSNDTRPLKVLKSVDGGQTFATAYTDTGYDIPGYYYNVAVRGETLAVSSQNPAVILIGTDHTLTVPRLIRSQNGGVTWNQLSPATKPRGAGSLDEMRAVANGRFIYMVSQTTPRMWYTDDDGDTWTQATMTPNPGGPVGRELAWWQTAWGQKCLVAIDNVGQTATQIWKTEDNGSTWDQIEDGSNILSTCAGFDYNPTDDYALILTRQGTCTVYRIDDPFGTPSISDVTDALTGSPDVGFSVNQLAIPYEGSPAAPSDIYVAEAASREAGELAIILNSATFTPAVYYTTAVLGDGSAWKRATNAPAKSRGRWIAPNFLTGEFVMGFDDTVVYLGDVTAGVLDMSVAAAALDAGDAANHGLWIGAYIGGIGGAYIVAAEGTADGTLYKSWDRFGSIGKLRPATGFPASPAGANAKQVAIGAGFIGATNLDERLVAIGLDASPREQSRLIGIGVDWDTPVSMTGITASGPRILPLTDQLWFAINSGDGTSVWTAGTGGRSKTGGDTWSATPNPGVGSGGIRHVARDVGGRVWCVTHEDDEIFTTTRVYYSEDDGDTWTLSTTINPRQQDRGWKILPHPANQNIIIIVGFSFHMGVASGWIHYTTNRGTSWTTNTGGFAEGQGGVLQFYDAIILPNGRIVIMGPLATGSPVPWLVRYSDDYGASWTTAWSVSSTNARVAGLFRSAPGDRVAFIYVPDVSPAINEHRLMVSRDGGASFAQETLAEELEDYLGADFYTESFTFSAERDALYISRRGGATKRIIKLTPVGSDGIWYDLTGTYPHASEGVMNLGVVPPP